jgi:2-oxoglutarate dehydrogenase complex dehydrogenase (E1) component-like enzyme
VHCVLLQPVPLSKLKDGFLDGTSSTYLEELEERFRDDPSSVDKTWASFFNNLGVQTVHPTSWLSPVTQRHRTNAQAKRRTASRLSLPAAVVRGHHRCPPTP